MPENYEFTDEDCIYDTDYDAQEDYERQFK